MESQPDLGIQLLDTSPHLPGTVGAKGDDRTLEALLPHLLIHQLELIPRQRLASLLWPDPGDFQAHTNLSYLLHHLRVAFPLIRCCCSQ